jgi:hypothetical protein
MLFIRKRSFSESFAGEEDASDIIRTEGVIIRQSSDRTFEEELGPWGQLRSVL